MSEALYRTETDSPLPLLVRNEGLGRGGSCRLTEELGV